MARDPGPWATVNVCDTIGHPDGIGIRGAMPGTGDRDDELFMRLQVQFFRRADGTWRGLGRGADSGFLDVGHGAARVRQAGRTFTLSPPAAGQPAFLLRGLVTFEWRRDGQVVRRARRLTVRRARRGDRRGPRRVLRGDLLDTVTGVRASVLPRRPGRALLAALAALAALVAVAPSATAQFRPSPWATINACDPPNAPGSVGVRISVPNRADAAQWARIRIQFFDGTRGAWSVVRKGGDSGFVRLSARRRPRVRRDDLHLHAAGGGQPDQAPRPRGRPVAARPARRVLGPGRHARQPPQWRRPAARGVAGDVRDRALTG